MRQVTLPVGAQVPGAIALNPGISANRTPKKTLRGVQVIAPLKDFLRTSVAGGVVLVAATLVAMVWANSAFSGSYAEFWAHTAGLNVGGWGLTLTLHQWVNDGLMTLFFFVVGLEIKREVVEGELNTRRKAALPAIAALGGMVIPALLFVAVNVGGVGVRGWGIPMATDIAMALGVLSLLGDRVPSTLKLFLLAIAIVDDIGAIVVIALFYAKGIDLRYAAAAVVVLGVVLVLRITGVRTITAYAIVGVAFWYVVKRSGVHATLAGVILGLLTPTRPFLSADLVDESVLADVGDPDAAEETVRMARDSVSVVERLEHRLYPWTSFVIVPLFALANAGIKIDAESVRSALSSRITLGVMLGLVFGKLIGVSLATGLCLRFGFADLPTGVTFPMVIGLASLAGIGFTVSIFVAGLAFVDPLETQAKLGILGASLVSAVLGSVLLLRTVRSS
jgi:Na+:H+ antiporter, NhaA family